MTSAPMKESVVPTSSSPRGAREPRPARRERHAVRVLVMTVVVAIAGGLGWWGARATMPSASTALPLESVVLTAMSQQGSVGRALTLNVTAERPVAQLATNALPGVVTAVHTGGEVATGGVLYEVAGTPVRALRGDVPFYRDLARGTKGQDVRQLDEALIELGYSTGAPSEDFGPRIEAAVKSWQKAMGRERTGVVAQGEVIAFTNLPSSVRLDDAIAPGLVLSGGEASVFAPVGTLDFVLSVSADQGAMIAIGTAVDVAFDGFTWPAVVAGSRASDDGSVRFILTAPGGGAVCGSDCGALPGEEKMSLLATVHVVPPVEVVTVPVAAIRSSVQGAAYVETSSGDHVDVTVLGSSGGVAVVDGLPAGVEVRIGSTPTGDRSPAPDDTTGGDTTEGDDA